jgi:hypothetical protein
LFGRTRTPLNCETFALSRHASHVDHVRVAIQADDRSLRSDERGNAPGDDTRSASHIKNAFTRVHIRRLNQIR